jgi:hypothetical protein
MFWTLYVEFYMRMTQNCKIKRVYGTSCRTLCVQNDLLNSVHLLRIKIFSKFI